jgi:hypothetical protein
MDISYFKHYKINPVWLSSNQTRDGEMEKAGEVKEFYIIEMCYFEMKHLM